MLGLSLIRLLLQLLLFLCHCDGCQVRITDFGLARYIHDSTRQGENDLNPMTEYVVTRWYRCPELLLSPNRPYTEAIDLWSVGCILAELLKRKPLFPGKSHANQVCNTPSAYTFYVCEHAPSSMYVHRPCVRVLCLQCP